jgi:hypothetical protein
MAVTVKKVVLWRKEINNRPGMLANRLEPHSRLCNGITASALVRVGHES